ncbi:MAG TPA: hypothetical protein VLL25_20285 [Acidimicrobiales bacterium]|nr:hypothetical protein [Acidimicrobiales bacterium]
MTTNEKTWDELCPDGAIRFYEGDDPDGFAAEMLALFGIDVRAPIPEDEWERGGYCWNEFRSYRFVIPPGLVGAVYGSDRWPLGS